jgi:hypothetical protein
MNFRIAIKRKEQRIYYMAFSVLFTFLIFKHPNGWAPRKNSLDFSMTYPYDIGMCCKTNEETGPFGDLAPNWV